MKQIMLLIAFAVILLISLSIAGCYTMLSHPAVIEDTEMSDANNDNSEEPMAVDYSHDCLQCHSTQNQVFINRFYNHYYDQGHPVSSYYWDNAPRSQYYYGSPWWLSDYYYSTAAVPMQGENSDSTLPRPGDYSRRPSSPTYPGSASMSSGGSAVGAVRATSSSAASSGSSESNTPSPSTRRPSNTKTQSSGTAKSGSSSTTKSKTKSKTKSETE